MEIVGVAEKGLLMKKLGCRDYIENEKETQRPMEVPNMRTTRLQKRERKGT